MLGGGGSVLLSFINLIKIRVIWEAVNQLNNFHLQMGLGDCQWRNIYFFKLLIDVGRSSPLWAVPPVVSCVRFE